METLLHSNLRKLSTRNIKHINMQQVTTLLTEDDANDLAIRIVDHLVKQGIVPDCTDTEDETEFQYQDEIKNVLIKEFNISLY